MLERITSSSIILFANCCATKIQYFQKATPPSHSRHFNFVPPISNTPGLLGKPPTILKRVVQHHILQPISTSSLSSPYLHPHHPFRKHRSHLQKFPPSFKTYHLPSSNNGRLVWVRKEDFTEKDTPKHYTISSNGIGSQVFHILFGGGFINHLLSSL